MTPFHASGKKLLLVTGKGGIGKTLLAAVMGVEAARAGKRVAIVEASARDQIAPLFGHEPVGHKQTEILPGLSVINLDYLENFKDYVTKYLKLPSLVDKIMSRALVTSLMEMLPGIAEIMTLGRLYWMAEILDQPKFDLVIFDGFASGHFLNLMTTPEAILEAGFIGPVRDETRHVLSFLSDPKKAGIIVVARCEPLVVKETTEFLEKFASASPTPVDGVVVNRFYTLPDHAMPLTEAEKKEPDLALALRYLARRDTEAREGMASLKSDLVKIAPSARLLCFEDRGIWPEPLTVAEALSWWNEGREIKLG